MTIKRALLLMAISFCVASTICFLIIGLYTLFVDAPGMKSSFNGEDILGILFMAFAVTLPILLFVRSEKASRIEIIIRRTIHFILTSGIVFGCLVYFKWINTANAIFVILAFVAMYFAGQIVMEKRERKLADELNKRINAFHNAENETRRN